MHLPTEPWNEFYYFFCFYYYIQIIYFICYYFSPFSNLAQPYVHNVAE